jgi:hypothetical protein
MHDSPIREALTDAIRYWERARIVYNLVLVFIVIFYFVANLPRSATHLTFDLAQGLFLLAVIANVAFCAAYLVDVFVQLSGVRAAWLRYRWVLFAIGLTFAGIVTRFVSLSLFANGG